MIATKKSYFLILTVIAAVGGGVAYKLTRTETTLMALAGKNLSKTSVFKPCDVKTGSLSIAFKSNEEVIINGVPSKVISFGELKGRDNLPMTSCTGEIVSKVSVVETGVYQFNISRHSNVLLISNVRNKLTDDLLPGTWTFE